MRSGEVAGDAGEMIPRDLWLQLDNVTERLGELVAGSDVVATELAMEVRRLHAAFEAGEITRDEAEEMLQTRLRARDVRLRWPDRPR